MKRTLLLIAIALIGSSHNVFAGYSPDKWRPTCSYIYQIVNSKQRKCADVTFKKVLKNATWGDCYTYTGKHVALNDDLGPMATLDAVIKAAKCNAYQWALRVFCDNKLTLIQRKS